LLSSYLRVLELSIENINEWLNENIFQIVIKNHIGLQSDEFKFISIDSKPAIKPGDNFMAILVRSNLEIIKNNGESIKLSYIVKCLLSNVFDSSLVSGYNAFPKEKEMYSKLLPEFEKLYENVGVSISFGPKCYYCADEPTQIIVMEDLFNFEMLPKREGLDQEHVECVLSWLSKFHAASKVYYEKSGPYDEKFRDGIFNLNMESIYQPYYDGYFDWFVEAVKNLPNGEKYVEKVEKWRGILFKNISKALNYDENSFNVLNHGDVWSNNAMFLHNEDRSVKDIKMVDFQLCFWGSVATDIFYFMMCSWNISIKVKLYDHFIEFYHKNFVKNLQLLNFSGKIPTYEHLKEELMKRKFVAAALTVENVPFPIAEKEIITADMNEEIFRGLYNNPRCKEAYLQLFPWLDSIDAFVLPN
jgi:Ecdysteroid kinase-like family